MLSVVIPLYNKESSIAKALNSVLNQSYQDFEVIVVNDGSTDNSAKIVQGFTDSRIRLIEQPNAGVSAARNKGIEAAVGEYVAFLDADDEWKSDYLSIQAETIAKFPNALAFATDYILKYRNGKLINNIINHIRFNEETGIIDNYFEVAASSNPPVWTSAVVVKKDAIKSIGGFPVGITSGEDLITWARLAVNGNIAYCKKQLAIYNLGEGSELSNLPTRRQDKDDYVGRELRKLYREHPDTPGLKQYISMWHKMRAFVALRYGERRETISEALKAIKFNPLNYKAALFAVLAIMPTFIRKKIITGWR